MYDHVESCTSYCLSHTWNLDHEPEIPREGVTSYPGGRPFYFYRDHEKLGEDLAYATRSSTIYPITVSAAVLVLAH